MVVVELLRGRRGGRDIGDGGEPHRGGARADAAAARAGGEAADDTGDNGAHLHTAGLPGVLPRAAALAYGNPTWPRKLLLRVPHRAQLPHRAVRRAPLRVHGGGRVRQRVLEHADQPAVAHQVAHADPGGRRGGVLAHVPGVRRRGGEDLPRGGHRRVLQGPGGQLLGRHRSRAPLHAVRGNEEALRRRGRGRPRHRDPGRGLRRVGQARRVGHHVPARSGAPEDAREAPHRGRAPRVHRHDPGAGENRP